MKHMNFENSRTKLVQELKYHYLHSQVNCASVKSTKGYCSGICTLGNIALHILDRRFSPSHYEEYLMFPQASMFVHSKILEHMFQNLPSCTSHAAKYDRKESPYQTQTTISKNKNFKKEHIIP